MEITNYDIEFKDVYFGYDNYSVINGVSFIAKQGEITALIGSSGSGKTTVAKLAARFWDIDRGKILIGGKDISEVDPETLLKNFSIVFQDVILFNTSIKDNIKIGKKNATDEEITRAAKIARCDDFINKMPEWNRYYNRRKWTKTFRWRKTKNINSKGYFERCTDYTA